MVVLPASSEIDFPVKETNIWQKWSRALKASSLAVPAYLNPIEKHAPAIILQYAWLEK